MYIYIYIWLCCLQYTFEKKDCVFHLRNSGDLSTEAEAAGNWGECCRCHETKEEEEDDDDDTKLDTVVPGPVPLSSSCPFRGCRAAELACGKGLEVQRSIILEDRVADQRW